MEKHSQQIGYRVYTTQRVIHHTLEVALKKYGITPGQWNLMNQLASAGELSQRALAEKTNKEQATITRYLDTLSRKGLIERNPDKNDRRAHLISLTSQAQKLIKEAQPDVIDAGEALKKGIDSQELDTFMHVLSQLHTNAENYVKEKS